ncbi:amidohydrolase [Imtechella halotolerans]|nr:amidohydrolase [Imtechella halotolerans]WMQ62353.1 amidohydrolase [Imtechella halotolerans]
MRKLILIIGGLLMSCAPNKKEVDFLVINANVYTVDSVFSTASAFAIEDGRFVAIGNEEEIQNRYTSSRILDAEGKTIVPGFIDAHCHFYGLGMNRQIADLSGTSSFEEVIQRMVAFQKENKSVVLRGRGWDQNDWEVKLFPSKERLDQLFPDTPVVLERIDGHAYLVNQKALEMAGIDARTMVPGGFVELHNGEPTGILVDSPMGLVDKVMPVANREMQINALLDAQEVCFKYGLTTVNDAGLDRDVIELIDSLQQVGLLDMRVYAMVSATSNNLDYYLPKGIVKTEKLHVRSVKVYGDGALGSRGAAMKASYSDKHNHFGAMVTTSEEVNHLAKRIAESDYQMNSHAIGDSANVVILKAYQSALQGKGDRRWKIEHAQIVDVNDFDYFSKGIIPSIQPTHATSDMYWAEERIGSSRMQGAYAYKTLLEKAGLVALGTDFPVEQVNPFHTFYAAVARKDSKLFPQEGFQMKDALSRQEALRGMTIWSAYSNFEEKEKGSIEIGKWADFIVLDKDIMRVPIDEVLMMKVEQTYLGGKQVN